MSNKEDLLFIHAPDKHDLIPENIKRSGYDIMVPYHGNALVLRILREIWFRLHLPYESIWYNKKAITEKKVIIVFDALIKKEYLLWLRKNNQTSRIVLYYSNPVKNTISPSDIPDWCCEKWSSDKHDCGMYNMHWDEHSGYFEHLRVKKEEPRYDVLYVGRDKGRASQLLALRDILQSMNLKSYIHIVADRKHKRFSKPYYKKAIMYDEVRELISKSRAIINLATNAQSWLTIRVFESIFNEIKLITDNEELCKSDIYEKDNIFILGKDDINELPAFLDKPYKKLPLEKIERYYFNNWVERITKSH